MSAAVSAILEGMPEPRDLRMREHDGRCVITAGQVVLFEYAAGDIVMRNIALAALRQLGFRGRVVAAALGLTENYVATLHNAAKRDGSAALIRQDRRGGPGKVTAAQWEQARAWRDQGVSDAETGRRLKVAHTTISRGLGPRGQAPASGGARGQHAPAEPLFTDPAPEPEAEPRPRLSPGLRLRLRPWPSLVLVLVLVLGRPAAWRGAAGLAAAGRRRARVAVCRGDAAARVLRADRRGQRAARIR